MDRHASQPVDASDLEHLFDPNRKPMFASKSDDFWRQHGRQLAEQSAFVVDQDSRGLVACVLELQREDFWKRHYASWDEACEQALGRPACWVEQVVQSVRALHGANDPDPVTVNRRSEMGADRLAADAWQELGYDGCRELIELLRERMAQQRAQVAQQRAANGLSRPRSARKPTTAAKVARALGPGFASESSMARMKVIRSHAPELVPEVAAGRMSTWAAYQQATRARDAAALSAAAVTVD